MKPARAFSPLIAPTRGITSCVECDLEVGGVLRTPISARTQAANDAAALAVIQWHTRDKLLHEALTDA